MVLMENHLCLFGGDSGRTLLNDTWTLDISSSPSTASNQPSEGGLNRCCTYSWVKVDLTPPANMLLSVVCPSRRSFHDAAVRYQNDKSEMIVYGGYVSQSVGYNRLYALSKSNNRWSWTVLPIRLRPRQDHRTEHTMVVLYDKVFIVGGKWTDPELQGPWVCCYDAISCNVFELAKCVSRYGHRSWLTDGMLYSWGGWTECDGLFGTTDELDAVDLIDALPEVECEELLRRRFHRRLRALQMRQQSPPSPPLRRPSQVDAEMLPEPLSDSHGSSSHCQSLYVQTSQIASSKHVISAVVDTTRHSVPVQHTTPVVVGAASAATDGGSDFLEVIDQTVLECEQHARPVTGVKAQHALYTTDDSQQQQPNTDNSEDTTTSTREEAWRTYNWTDFNNQPTPAHPSASALPSSAHLALPVAVSGGGRPKRSSANRAMESFLLLPDRPGEGGGQASKERRQG
eukprot:GHVS01009523.1.p1 GENE.GHVS01009523.1~~GHVS01009523.1.p1  ORF type:complete len:456 (-),score=70.79 GHVS01009523.1:114-1481(-)